MNKFLYWLLVPISLLPGACHFQVTGPALWAHNSSTAFDAWILLWVICAALPVYVLVLVDYVLRRGK